MEEERRTKEFAKQLEIKHKIEQAGNVAQKIELEAKGRRKTQEAKDEGAHLAAEAENLEKVRNFVHYNDPESLPNRLRDFDDDSLELIYAKCTNKSCYAIILIVPTTVWIYARNMPKSCSKVAQTFCKVARIFLRQHV